jgi:hypothetical protein
MSHALSCFLQMMDGGTVIAAAGFDAWRKKWALGHRGDAITGVTTITDAWVT